MDDKVKKAFPGAVIRKSKDSSVLLKALELPAQVASWILMKFSQEDGKIDAFGISEYVKNMRLRADEWNIRLLEARHSKKGTITLLTKVKIEFDYANDLICFSLPEYGFPKRQKEAQVDWSVVSENKKYLLTPDAAWGEVTLLYDCGIISMIEFNPLCPYTFNMAEYRKARESFSVEEWIDTLLGGLNFNPNGFDNLDQKLTLLQRFLPFVEKRLNVIELAIKGSGKTYCYSQLSQHNWLTSGTVSRATAFYNNTTKKVGYFGSYDNVIWDEVQTLKCLNPEEINGVLKPYLESGEIRIGGYSGMADAGLTLVGNVDINSMNPETSNIFSKLPKFFKESALVDRFSMIIDGKKIGRFDESRKMEGWSLSAHYLTEMLHTLRDEFYYRAIVDELIVVEGKADTRNLEAIKKNCTAYLKLLFPHVTKASQIDLDEFDKFCLKPAIYGRHLVLCQLRLLDKEYEGVEMPNIKVNREV